MPLAVSPNVITSLSCHVSPRSPLFYPPLFSTGKGDSGKKPLSLQAPVVSAEDKAIETAVVKELATLTKTLFLDEGTEPVISPEEVEEEVRNFYNAPRKRVACIVFKYLLFIASVYSACLIRHSHDGLR